MTTIPTPNRPRPRRARALVRLLTTVAAIAALCQAQLAAPAPAEALTWRAPACTEFVGCNAAALSNTGYQAVYTTSFWYMYGGHNCTNYVAFRLQQDGIARFVRTGHGNAWEWGSEARLAGIAVDRGTPRPGDVAWWDKAAIGGMGHVAYVESVDAAAGTFTVSEDNYSSTFDWRTYRISEVSGFIRVAKKQITAPAQASISGTALPGGTLTASPGAWAPSDVRLAYQWLRDGVYIPGATARTYTVAAADAGRTLSVQVTATKSGYNAKSRLSRPVAVPVQTFTSTPTPRVSGTPAVGEVLTAIRGTWQPGSITYAYQWMRDGAPIAGARSKTYVPVSADAGRKLSVRVTGSRPGFRTVSLTSAPTSAILQRFPTPRVPTVSGEPRVGATLTAIRGTWAPSGVTYTYQWFRNGSAIRGASGKTYFVAAADRGARLTVRVTAAKTGYLTESRTSAATPAVAG